MTKNKKDKYDDNETLVEAIENQFLELEELTIDSSDADFFSEEKLESEKTLREEEPEPAPEPEPKQEEPPVPAPTQEQTSPVSMQTSAKLGKILTSEKKAGTRTRY